MWEKTKRSVLHFFSGRYGIDSLSKFLMWTGIALSIIELIVGVGLLSFLAMLLYLTVLFRMFSRNIEKRTDENQKFTAISLGFRTKYNQAKVRFKNRKEYKYIRCPHCHAWIRIKRGTGKVFLRCKACSHTFNETA